MRKPVDDYHAEVTREYHRSVRAWQKSGSTGEPPEPPPIDQKRIEQIVDEQIAYYVHGWVLIYTDTMGDDPMEPSGSAVMRKRAKYDWTDADTDDMEVIYLD